ncbi:MAG: DUF255 domain-containing protein [Candidatus Zixiibacteriota bacterium]
MKKLLMFAFAALFVFALAFATENEKKEEKAKDESTTKKTEIHWLKYDEGLKLAKEKNVHVFINFTTSWCGWCKRMDQTTFAEPEIVKMMNEDFVSVKVDAESKFELNIDGYKITEKDLALAEYGARSYPTYWFLKSDGEKLGKLSGYQQADNFNEILYFMKESLYTKMTFEEYIKAGGKEKYSKS